MTPLLMATEVKRKLIHISSGFVALSFLVLGRELALNIVTIATFGIFVAEALRLKTDRGSALYNRFFGSMTRDSEASSLTGASHMLVGTLVTLLLFPLVIAVPALLFLSWGDAAAALVGQKYGRHPIVGSKTLEGTLACLAVCLIIALPFTGLTPLVKIAGAASATLAELIPWGIINDNLAIPLVSGGVMLSLMATGI